MHSFWRWFSKPVCWIGFSHLWKHIAMPHHQEIKVWAFSYPVRKKKRIPEEQNGMMRSMQQKVSFFGKGKKKVKKWCSASVNRILLKIFNLSNIKQIMHYINTQLLHQLLVYRSEHVKECSLATDSKERYWVRRGWKNTWTEKI